MRFLDPTTDLMFKKLFANQAEKEIVISFLNSVLGREDGELIVDVKIADALNSPDNPKFKFSSVDACCTDQDGNKYIVEMQVGDENNYVERSQYYTALTLSRQLEFAEKYSNIMPVIFVGVLGFTLFKNNKNYLSNHRILDVKTYEHALRHSEFCFIELEKFDKNLDELGSVVDRWIYFLKNAKNLETVPEQLKDSEVFEKAFHVLERGALSPKELTMYDKFLDARRQEQDVIETVQAKAKAKGREEGKAEGERQKALSIAKQMLAKKLSPVDIAEMTGMPVDEIEKLKQ